MTAKIKSTEIKVATCHEKKILQLRLGFVLKINFVANVVCFLPFFFFISCDSYLIISQ